VLNRHRLAMAGVLLGLSVPADAQVVPCSTVEKSANLPPADSPPLLRCYELVFDPDGTHLLSSRPISTSLLLCCSRVFAARASGSPTRKTNASDVIARMYAE
jgi:hypothetical protein